MSDEDIFQIGRVKMCIRDSAKIRLSQVAEIKLTTGASTISREMNMRHITIRDNLRGIDLTSFLQKANRMIDDQVKYNQDVYKRQPEWREKSLHGG